VTETRYEFISLEVLARCASILGPGSPPAAALALFAKRADRGQTPICLQVIDGTYPATLLVFDAPNPPEEIPESLKLTFRGVGKNIGRKAPARLRQKENAVS
jgi:hypothetical protein